jgi:hypothetical protein
MAEVVEADVRQPEALRNLTEIALRHVVRMQRLAVGLSEHKLVVAIG